MNKFYARALMNHVSAHAFSTAFRASEIAENEFLPAVRNGTVNTNCGRNHNWLSASNSNAQ